MTDLIVTYSLTNLKPKVREPHTTGNPLTLSEILITYNSYTSASFAVLD